MVRDPRLPNQPSPEEKPLFRRWAMADPLPPGPGRRLDRRHFARQEWIGRLFLGTMVLTILYFVGADLGVFPDFLGVF